MDVSIVSVWREGILTVEMSLLLPAAPGEHNDGTFVSFFIPAATSVSEKGGVL